MILLQKRPAGYTTESSVAFTGHRPEQLDSYNEDLLRLVLQSRLQELIDAGYDTFYCGMAKGFDILAGELVATLREQYPWIRLIGAIPFPGQSRGWSADWQERYTWLLHSCDQVVSVSESGSKAAFLLRNRYMIDRSARLIAFYNGSEKGGTAYTVRYAKKKGLEIEILPPEDFR